MPPGASLQGDPISLSKNSVEMNPLKLERGSSRGRQPASNEIKCPGSLAVRALFFVPASQTLEVC